MKKEKNEMKGILMVIRESLIETGSFYIERNKKSEG